LPTTDFALKLEVIFCVQGVISPLLSNLYLNEVDRMLERAKEVTRYGKYTGVEYARFADDLVILIDSHPRHDWLPWLAPRHTGRAVTVGCDAAACTGKSAAAGFRLRGVLRYISCVRRAAGSSGNIFDGYINNGIDKTMERVTNREIPLWPVISTEA
jgi:hypothetical protein